MKFSDFKVAAGIEHNFHIRNLFQPALQSQAVKLNREGSSSKFSKPQAITKFNPALIKS